MDQSVRKLRTVELQKRKVTQSKSTIHVVDRKLANVYAIACSLVTHHGCICAPKNFDEDSAVIVCNFPQKTTMNECRNFMQWIGPVIKVEKTASLVQENNFVVVFCSPHYAKIALETPLLYDNKIQLFTRPVEKRETFWKNINDMIYSNVNFFS